LRPSGRKACPILSAPLGSSRNLQRVRCSQLSRCLQSIARIPTFIVSNNALLAHSPHVRHCGDHRYCLR
jgi:hypothetical protein